MSEPRKYKVVVRLREGGTSTHFEDAYSAQDAVSQVLIVAPLDRGDRIEFIGPLVDGQE